MPKPLPNELYHYTGIAGLKGIIESETLWATHYQYLNDGEEVVHFKELLPELLRPVLKTLFEEAPSQEKLLERLRYPSIETALEAETKQLATNMFDSAFVTNKDNQTFAEPYVVSFCTVEDKDVRTASHGLLSQWRGYGTAGGYALVFQTKQFLDLLSQEEKAWPYSFVSAGEVVYSSATEEARQHMFWKQIEDIHEGLAHWFRAGSEEALGSTFEPLVSCASRYKHWGFSEEREFRIVVSPKAVEVLRAGNIRLKVAERRKPVKFFCRGGTSIPYLNLFEGMTGRTLPISRIIVGPHPDKARRVLAVKSLLSQNNVDAEVSVSAIPYLG